MLIRLDCTKHATTAHLKILLAGPFVQVFEAPHLTLLIMILVSIKSG